YSTNGTTWTTIGTQYAVLANGAPNNTFNNTAPVTYRPEFNFYYDLSNIAALNNQGNVFFRMANSSAISAGSPNSNNAGAVASAGTDRIDNVIITGVSTSGTAGTQVSWNTGSATWDTSTSNWTGGGTSYTDGNQAAFNDRAGTTTVTVQGAGVTPARVTVN